MRRVGGRERLRLVVRAVLGALLFLAVLGCVTFSKLSLLALADKLRSMTVNSTKQEVTLATYIKARSQIADIWNHDFTLFKNTALVLLRS